MDFERAHGEFIAQHLARRTGERRGRLERGHKEAEKLFCHNIWWKLRGNFDQLHPEYEVIDWRGIPYYCDFVWITWIVRLVIEIKGYGPHVRDMDRRQYCKELNRETFLTAAGYQVISFSYDDVAHNPEQCITLLRMVLNRYQAIATPIAIDTLVEREIIRLACMLVRPLRPIDVKRHLGIDHRTVVRALQSLCAKAWFHPIMGEEGKYTVSYQLHPSALQGLLA